MTALLALLLSHSAVWAYPPAPDAVIYGMAKDQYGNPLANPADLVIVQTSTGVQVVANIQPNLAVGVNYAVQIPMDAGSIAPPYVSNALTTGAQFQLFVVVNSATNLPMEMQGVTLTLGAPSQKVLQNLTLGLNLDNSGVPLAWAEAFLASLGLNVPAENINPYGIYTQDGRTLQQEYALGNFPYQTNAFNVKIISQTAGSAVLAFTTAAGHTYTASGSSDLKNWTPLSFTIPAVGSTPLTSYFSSTNLPVQIQTIPPSPTPQIQFFRLQLQ
ncbi:MAG TPA: hypothetical protein VFC44_14240 [Candidatus Saccharimonadales bacterium]|nr:hypothetical protein [Candidatus Saccharimonadales bacterium]